MPRSGRDACAGSSRPSVTPVDGSPPYSVPAAEPAQIAQGERVLGIFASAGAAVVAEDLGTVPDFVRASLARLGLPGYRVLRWEKETGTIHCPCHDGTFDRSGNPISGPPKRALPQFGVEVRADDIVVHT